MDQFLEQIHLHYTHEIYTCLFILLKDTMIFAPTNLTVDLSSSASSASSSLSLSEKPLESSETPGNSFSFELSLSETVVVEPTSLVSDISRALSPFRSLMCLKYIDIDILSN